MVKNTDSVKSAVKNAVKNADYKKKKEKKDCLRPLGEKRTDDDDAFFPDLIQSLVETLTDINKQLPAKSSPLSGLSILAEQLASPRSSVGPRGETSETARAAWQTCQKRARNPLGAFLVWCRDNYLPIGSKRERPQSEPAPAPKPPAAKRESK